MLSIFDVHGAKLGEKSPCYQNEPINPPIPQIHLFPQWKFILNQFAQKPNIELINPLNTI